MRSGFLVKSKKACYSEGEIEEKLLEMKAKPYDKSVQEKACVYISDLWERRDVHHVVLKHGGIEMLIAALKNFPKVTHIQFSALWDLKYLAGHTSQRIKQIQSGVIDLLIIMMKSHQEILMLQQLGMEFLTEFAINGQEKACARPEILDMVNYSMRKHRQYADFLYFAIYFVAAITEVDGVIKAIIDKGILRGVVDIMKSTLHDEEVQAAIVTLLARISKGEFIETIVKEADMDLIAQAMKRFPSSQKIQAGVCQIIDKCGLSVEFEDVFGQSRAVEHLVESLDEYQKPDMIEYALNAITSIAASQSLASKLKSAGAIEKVRRLLDENPHSVQVQNQARSFLTIMGFHFTDDKFPATGRGGFDRTSNSLGKKFEERSLLNQNSKKQTSSVNSFEKDDIERIVASIEGRSAQSKENVKKGKGQKRKDNVNAGTNDLKTGNKSCGVSGNLDQTNKTKDQAEMEESQIIGENTESSQSVEDPSNGCVICMNSFASHAYIPCGHQCVCLECSTQFANRCPVCNQESQMVIKIWQYAA